VPYGTDSLLNASQAINCLATIIQSLRDGRFLPTLQPRKLLGWLRSFSPSGTSSDKPLRDNKPSLLSTFSTPHHRTSSRTRTLEGSSPTGPDKAFLI
jgi:hypothetical protein